MYPVYKLIRAINRQYPNNGFINAVDVTEELNDGLIPEDFRDLLNETMQEIYHEIALDEMYTFPTVPGQKEYELPEDCDLRDIQEVTRTFAGRRGPLAPPPPPCPGPGTAERAIMFDANGGTGEMEPVIVVDGAQYVLPTCQFNPPEGKEFMGWNVDGVVYGVGDAIEVHTDLTISPVWDRELQLFTVTFTLNPIIGSIGEPGNYKRYSVLEGECVPSLPTVVPNEGKNFFGWSLEEPYVIPDNIILNTEVYEDMTYTGLGRSKEYTVMIYIKTPGGTGILHYTELGGTAQTKTMTYGGDVFEFTITSNQQISDVYSVLAMYDDTDTTMVADLINVPITGDKSIGVAVPVVENGVEIPADNNDGDYEDNPLGENEEATPDVIPDDEEPLDNDNGGYGDNPLGGGA